MDQVVAKIRKLLRLAASGGPEGEIAQLRADELMAKHGLKITLEDEKPKERLVVENVAGENWRERLMDAVARQYRCKFVINRRAATVGMIIGDELHARHAMEAYETLRRAIEQRCEESWSTIVRVIYDLAVPSVKELWLHIVRVFAVQGVVDRLQVPDPVVTPVDLVPAEAPVQAAPEPEPEPEPEPDPASTVDDDNDDYDYDEEVEATPAVRPSDAPSANDVARIASQIGNMHVHMIRQAAISFGQSIAREMSVPVFTVDEQQEAKRDLKQIA